MVGIVGNSGYNQQALGQSLNQLNQRRDASQDPLQNKGLENAATRSPADGLKEANTIKPPEKTSEEQPFNLLTSQQNDAFQPASASRGGSLDISV